VRSVAEEPIEIGQTPALVGGLLQLGSEEALVDNGFYNIGVRAANEDLGRGRIESGFPLSFVRQTLADAPFAHPEPGCTPGVDCPDRVQVDGAFKVPDLRNVELTGPYFHNGGRATLAQVIEFYDHQSDFGDVNIVDLDANIALVDLDEADKEPLVAFLLALTDDRVRDEQAPFDHPQIFVPNGHPGDQNAITCLDAAGSDNPGVTQACTDFRDIPAVGAGGLSADGLPPLGTFLDLDPYGAED
jgi:hypothetical protein